MRVLPVRSIALGIAAMSSFSPAPDPSCVVSPSTLISSTLARSVLLNLRKRCCVNCLRVEPAVPYHKSDLSFGTRGF